MTTETPASQPSDAQDFEALNHDCFCYSLDRDALAGALESELGQPGLSALIRERCPFVFAAQPVFVAPQALRQIAEVVRAVETVVAMPAYREQVLADAPPIARSRARAPRGVCFGYDFHWNHGRLGLIEINTNAGGAMLNALLARAQRACCEAMAGLLPTPASILAFEQRVVDMFREEWRLAGPRGSARHHRHRRRAARAAVPVPGVPAVPAPVRAPWPAGGDCRDRATSNGARAGCGMASGPST
jgi:hypothetical protein